MHLMTEKLNLNNVIRAVIDRPCICGCHHKWATNGRPTNCKQGILICQYHKRTTNGRPYGLQTGILICQYHKRTTNGRPYGLQTGILICQYHKRATNGRPSMLHLFLIQHIKFIFCQFTDFAFFE